MKTKLQKKVRIIQRKKIAPKRVIKRSAPRTKKTVILQSESLSARVHQPRRTWRKPLSYFLNRLFNLDPYRDFGILDELIGGLFVFMFIATTITVIFGKEINTAWVDTNNADWQKGTKQYVEIVGSDIRLEGQGGGWMKHSTMIEKNITAITMLDASSGWAVGEEGTILRITLKDNEVTWQNFSGTTQDNLWGVAFADASFGFAVGDNGTILKWNGSSWTAMESETALSLLGIALPGRDNGVAVGEGGTILEWNGSAWTLVDPSPTDQFLSSVAIANDRVLVVGEAGAIITRDGASWSVMQQSLTTNNFLAVKIIPLSSDRFLGIAVGEGGTILHWNGSFWSKKKGSGPDLNSVAIINGSTAVAGGSDGAVARWDGSAWNTENVDTGESILSIAAPTSTIHVAVGSMGFVATYKGITYEKEGIYESATKDAGKEVVWDTIQWGKSGTTIRLQVAANNDNKTWDDTSFVGPDSTKESYYTNTNGEKISPSFGKKRYLRYRAFLTTSNTSTTPSLQAVTINSKEEITDEPPPEKKKELPPPEPKEVEKIIPEIPPPPTPEKNLPAPEETKVDTEKSVTTTPTPGEAGVGVPTPTGVGTGSGGGTAQRVVSPQLVTPTTNALLQIEALAFQWEPTEATTSYMLQIDRTPSFSSPLVQTTVATTSYTNSTALPAGSYFWRVLPDITATSERRGDWSSAATFTLTDKPPLPKVASPTLSKPIGVDSNTVTLEGIAFPHATVRIIITSNIVEKTVVADENGAWRIDVDRSLFASGQHLAQAQIFTTEGQVTPAVAIGEFFIPFPPPPTKSAAVATARAIGVAATQVSDATKKAARKTVEETVVVAEKTEKIIQENKTETQVALGAAVPIVTIANPTVLPMLSNLHFLFFHFISGFLSLFGIKRKRRPWGIVYDAITKEPIGLVIIRLFDASSKKLLETQVTDNEGRFGFLVQPSSYTLEVVKQDFAYPSTLVTGKTDGDYEDTYHGEALATKEGVINVSVPLDPLNRKEARRKQPLLLAAKSTMHTLALPLLIVGWASSWLVMLFAYSPTNLAMTFIYLFFAIIHVVLLPKKFRPWGTVFSANSLEPVPLAVISIIDTKFNRVLKSRLTDYSGRFNFLPPAGEYKLSVKKEGFDFPSKTKPETRKFRNLYFGQNIIVKKEKAIVSTDVPVEKR